MLLTIIYDALICGTNQSHIDQITSLFSGVPLALDDSTVVACGTDVKGLFIATETHIYRVPAHSLPVVSTGSELKRGDPLCEIHNPKTPKGLTGIELDKVLQLLGVTAQDTQG
jgi:hypothetical protein